MFELKRIVRFAVGGTPAQAPTLPNGYAGSPPMAGLGAQYELEISCRGMLGQHTGYLSDIKTIDRAARSTAIPLIAGAFAGSPGVEAGELLPAIVAALAHELNGLFSHVSWNLTPYYRVEMSASDTSTVLLRQRFDFAAAHRLHNPILSDQENRDLFGKCNLPSGHGHNYQIEPCVAAALDADGHQRFLLRQLEEITGRVIIERFDHKHLNLDAPEFAQPGGVNPTVENIARVCFDLLAPHISRGGATLRNVTVWETDRTSCTYPA